MEAHYKGYIECKYVYTNSTCLEGSVVLISSLKYLVSHDSVLQDNFQLEKGSVTDENAEVFAVCFINLGNNV
jgi:hypothetical protein